MENMPDELIHAVRSYRVHQSLDMEYTLLLTPAHTPSAEFEPYVQSEWAKISGHQATQIGIKTMDKLPSKMRGKFRYFTSEFISMDDG